MCVCVCVCVNTRTILITKLAIGSPVYRCAIFLGNKH